MNTRTPASGMLEAVSDLGHENGADAQTPPGDSAPGAGDALFWFRPCSDGGYEGPIHNDRIEDVRKLSGAWLPLYTARHAAPPVSAQRQAKDESRPSWLEGGDDAVAMAREDGLLPTASKAVSPARAVCDTRLLAALQLTRRALIGYMPQHRNEAIVAAIVAAREALDTALSAYQQQGDKQC